MKIVNSHEKRMNLVFRSYASKKKKNIIKNTNEFLPNKKLFDFQKKLELEIWIKLGYWYTEKLIELSPYSSRVSSNYPENRFRTSLKIVCGTTTLTTRTYDACSRESEPLLWLTSFNFSSTSLLWSASQRETDVNELYSGRRRKRHRDLQVTVSRRRTRPFLSRYETIGSAAYLKQGSRQKRIHPRCFRPDAAHGPLIWRLFCNDMGKI